MLPRFGHILVPLDFTTKNRAALDIAFEMAELNKARVSLLHVIERIEADAEDDETRAFYRRLEKRADAELESLSQQFQEAGLETEYRVRYGKRAQEIFRFMDEKAVDLVVLSSHPLEAGEPVRSMVSISYQVSLLARCPVLLVK